MKKILITGANGFVGSQLTAYFTQRKDYKVFCLVRKTGDLTFLQSYLKQIELCYGDIQDKSSIENSFKDMDYVIHAAAFASDWGKKSYFTNVNVGGTKNVAELCLENKIKHLIHISTVNVYGIKKQNLTDENSSKYRDNFIYNRTKREAEEVLMQYDIPATILQPGQIYGPNDRTMSFPIIGTIQKNKFGFVNNGKQLLSPLYIDNLIQAVNLVLKNPKKSIHQHYIVTDNIKINWKEFIVAFCEELNCPVPRLNIPGGLALPIAWLLETVYKLARIKKAPLLTTYRIKLVSNDFYFSPEKIIKELNYKPAQDLKKQIQKTIQSYQKNKLL